MNTELSTRLQKRQATLRMVQELLVTELYLEVDPEDLDPDAPLFGSGHGLDSIDAVEILVALEGKFQARLEGDRVDAVRHLRTVNTIVDRILSEQAAQ